MLNEINDLAGQHEVIAENLSTAVVSDLTTLVKSMKDDRRKVREDGSVLCVTGAEIDESESFVENFANHQSSNDSRNIKDHPEGPRQIINHSLCNRAV